MRLRDKIYESYSYRTQTNWQLFFFLFFFFVCCPRRACLSSEAITAVLYVASFVDLFAENHLPRLTFADFGQSCRSTDAKRRPCVCTYECVHARERARAPSSGYDTRRGNWRS